MTEKCQNILLESHCRAQNACRCAIVQTKSETTREKTDQVLGKDQNIMHRVISQAPALGEKSNRDSRTTFFAQSLGHIGSREHPGSR